MQKFELDGEVYIYNNGKWLTSGYMSAPVGMLGQLNALLAQDEDFTSKSETELISIIDNAKQNNNNHLAIKAAEEAMKRHKMSVDRQVLPRLTSLYRESGNPHKAIELYEKSCAKYEMSLQSPALFTSLAAAYCDMGEIETARKFANRAKAMARGVSSQELINVYSRIKSLE